MLLHKQNQRKYHLISISATFWTCFFSQFSSFNDEIIKVQVLQRVNNVPSHNQEENKLNSFIIENNGTHTLTDDKIIKTYYKANVVA